MVKLEYQKKNSAKRFLTFATGIFLTFTSFGFYIKVHRRTRAHKNVESLQVFYKFIAINPKACLPYFFNSLILQT